MSREKTITVEETQFEEDEEEDGKFYSGTYILRRWRWGEKIDATGKATKTNVALKTAVLDVSALQLETLATCLRKAPFTHTAKAPNYEALKNMPEWLGEYLSELLVWINKPVGVPKSRKKSSKRPTKVKRDQTIQPG